MIIKLAKNYVFKILLRDNNLAVNKISYFRVKPDHKILLLLAEVKNIYNKFC